MSIFFVWGSVPPSSEVYLSRSSLSPYMEWSKTKEAIRLRYKNTLPQRTAEGTSSKCADHNTPI